MPLSGLSQFPFKLINCKNSIQNAPKHAFLSSKIEKKFWGGAEPLPRSLPVDRGTPLPHTQHLGAFGTSTLAPTALDSTGLVPSALDLRLRAYGASAPGATPRVLVRSYRRPWFLLRRPIIIYQWIFARSLVYLAYGQNNEV